MALDPLTAGLDLAKTLVDKIWPDKSEQEKLEIAGAIAAVQGQIDTNKEEAKSSSILVAGWRPAVGWVGAVSLAMIYIPKAVVLTAIWTYQCYISLHSWNGALPVPVLPAYPDLGVSDLVGLLLSMLGMAGFRSFDKKNGVAS